MAWAEGGSGREHDSRGQAGRRRQYEGSPSALLTSYLRSHATPARFGASSITHRPSKRPSGDVPEGERSTGETRAEAEKPTCPETTVAAVREGGVQRLPGSARTADVTKEQRGAFVDAALLQLDHGAALRPQRPGRQLSLRLRWEAFRSANEETKDGVCKR